jgi:hypothetical protein
MASLTEIKRRCVLPLAGAAVAAYYLVVFVPLAHRAESIDQPLQKGWARLASSLEQSNANTLDFTQITNQLNETRAALALLEDVKKKAAARMDVTPQLRTKMSAPFQLVDYQNERSKQIDDLDRQARQQQVNIDPSVYLGFPEHMAEMPEPSLLWAALSLTDDLLESAVRCKVGAVHSLEVAVAATNSVSGEVTSRWAEIALQVEFTAPAENALRLVKGLPLRNEEMAAAGLPAATRPKAPLFIDRLIVRKENSEKPDEVRIWVRALGFVLKD